MKESSMSEDEEWQPGGGVHLLELEDEEWQPDGTERCWQASHHDA